MRKFGILLGLGVVVGFGVLHFFRQYSAPVHAAPAKKVRTTANLTPQENEGPTADVIGQAPATTAPDPSVTNPVAVRPLAPRSQGGIALIGRNGVTLTEDFARRLQISEAEREVLEQSLSRSREQLVALSLQHARYSTNERISSITGQPYNEAVITVDPFLQGSEVRGRLLGNFEMVLGPERYQEFEQWYPTSSLTKDFGSFGEKPRTIRIVANAGTLEIIDTPSAPPPVAISSQERPPPTLISGTYTRLSPADASAVGNPGYSDDLVKAFNSEIASALNLAPSP